ncbi:MAG TPA: LysE family translocator [Rhodopila sp.]|uniref:LysE family translocator n=1 Tax=Rhodopila sp. TaxID=2480087 RepID=UPI002C791124|nr:LysE family translocator [Rhodopila sp.]HVY17953.1 LysE family translocator [Rhodopila sp.]
MMDPALFLTFVLAVTLLMLTPGPNVALIIANSVAYGPRYGFLTIAGTTSAMAVQLCLTGLGMTALLGEMGVWFEWLRWVGVAYLFYLGIRQWRAPAVDLSTARARPAPARSIYLRALFVSLTNPKTLFFYAVFFPQFIVANGHIGFQVMMLSVTFVTLAVVVDGGWVMLADRARGILGRSGRVRNRISGGFLMGAGAILAFAGRK